MRGSVAKQFRRYLRARYKFLSDEPLYRQLPTGTIVLGESCKRAMYQSMKRTYKQKRQRGTI